MYNINTYICIHYIHREKPKSWDKQTKTTKSLELSYIEIVILR